MSDAPSLVLLGRGRMGRLVAERAAAQGASVVGMHGSGPLPDGAFDGATVAVDFSVAEAVPGHVAACVAAGVPVVVGTTGWADRLGDVTRTVEEGGGTLIYGANFSVGVHVFYRLAAYAAGLFERAGGYAPFLEEQHHAAKRDAPSGTALELRRRVAAHFPDDPLGVAVTRAGSIPGTHRVGFDGPPDTVLLTHTARTREGFADGALLAARWARTKHVAGRHGVFTFDTVMEGLLDYG